MAEKTLVNALQMLFHQLSVEKGVTIDRAALTPAYEGMVSGLFTLTVSMSGGTDCSDKVRCLIYAMHDYVPLEQRQSIAGVRVFDSGKEFDYFIKYGHAPDTRDLYEGEFQNYPVNRRPEMIPVEA
jgi:hypothetical protein